MSRASNLAGFSTSIQSVAPSNLVVGVVTATTFSGQVNAGVGTFTTLKVGTGVTISAGIITATSSITIGSTDVLTAISAKASTGKAIAMAIVFG